MALSGGQGPDPTPGPTAAGPRVPGALFAPADAAGPSLATLGRPSADLGRQVRRVAVELDTAVDAVLAYLPTPPRAPRRR